MHDRSTWWRPEDHAGHGDWRGRSRADRPYWWRDDNLPFDHDEARAQREYEDRERATRYPRYGDDDRRYGDERYRDDDAGYHRHGRRRRSLGEKMRAMLSADSDSDDGTDMREYREHRRDERRDRRDFRGVGPRLRADDDEDLRDEICERLRDDPDLDASDILVRVIDNEAILDGTVRSKRDAERARHLANDVRGVVYVRDRLRVGRSGDDRVRRATIGMGYDETASSRRRWS